MNVYDAIKTTRQGSPAKAKKGLQGNSTAVFTTNAISIIFERYKEKNQSKEMMFSVRNFGEQAKDLEFYEV